ncbi:MAG: amino acid adenylation domain-containing protein [Candidatus Rokubacteria bacterium]|nr:amino acid adenylation domain-containing protein [Candidatus Rokubacteria bacterium]
MTTAGDGRLQRIYPVSFAQQRMWLLDRLDPGSPAYNIARAIRMRGALSPDVLRRSLQALVTRHESLRTTFAEIDGEPVQRIAGDRTVKLPMIDLRGVPEAEREPEARRRARDEAQRPFDLTRGPLMRATLLRLGEDQHVLILVLHHIVTDAWSMSVLFDEIGRLYEAFAAGRPSSLADLPIQYGDFARWQRQTLTPTLLAPHLAYWADRLAGVAPVLDLPTDHPRPATRTPRGGTQTVVFPAALRERLKAVGREANATLFMTLAAAFLALLGRYTGRDDLVIGTPTAGRGEVELEPLIGFFVNTLVLRTDLAGDPTARELVGRVREAALEAYAHQAVPFERLIEALEVPRSLSHTPLFQVMFILQNTRAQTLTLPGLTLDELEFDSGTAKFDLTVEMAEVADGLHCGFEYSRDVFEPATVARMLWHFEALLEGIAADPGCRLSALPLMSAAERRQVVEDWNDTAAPYDREQSIHGLFAIQAERTPEAVALVGGGEAISYRALEARANQLAHHLRARGVGRGVCVGVCIERSIEAVVALLGVLKAGGAYVPLDSAYPEERLAFMLEDSRAPVLLTVERLRGRVRAGAAERVCLDSDADRIAGHPATRPRAEVTGDDPAYIIYTSGSMGRPKGVLAPHRASVNRFAWMWRAWPFAPGEVACQKTTLSFVDSVWEIFGPLLQGVRAVIIPDEELGDPERLVGTLGAHRVTRIVLVPSLLRMLVEGVPDLAARAPALRLWITSGEAITPELARRFEERVPGATLLNLYGSSEVAADVTAYVVTGSPALERIPIGRPIANTRADVLDRARHPVPIGVAGEIHIGGDGLAHGYLDNPELTAERFVPDPFAPAPGGRLYRTGDLGRWRPDGNLECLGRVDDQVKIRGVRIELGEIESVLRTHPSVRSAAVAVAGSAGDERLIAYLVPGGEVPPPAELRHFVRTTLPDYMVPASFVVLDALPLTPSGKVDRRALPAPEAEGRASDRTPTAPRTATEQTLAGIVGEVLARDGVGIDDNFFDLGGHSLLGMQVLARVRRALGVELSLRVLFEEPTVAGLAAEVDRAAAGAGPAPSVPPPRIDLSSREQLLARLDHLSDDEVRALLSGITRKTPGTP